MFSLPGLIDRSTVPSLVAALALVLAACAPAAQPSPTGAPAAKPTEAPRTAAPAATTAPAAPAAPAATTAPAAPAATTAPAPAPKPTDAAAKPAEPAKPAAQPTVGQPAAGGPAAGGPAAGAPKRIVADRPAATIQGPEIKLGIITLTEGGPLAANGQRSLEGARFAVKEINAAGGIGGVPIKLVETDTKTDVNTVANIVRRLATEDKVLGIVGPLLSGECRVACPLANQLKVPMISPGAAQAGVLEGARPYAFRLVQPDDANSRPVIEAIIKRLNVKKAGLIRDEKDASQKFMGESFWPAVFKANGVEVAADVTFTTNEPSFAAQVTRLKAANPDVVALAAQGADAARIALEMRRQGMQTQLISSGVLQSSGVDFVQAGGQAVEGTLTAAQFDPDDPNPEVQALVKGYLAGTGSPEVTLNAAYSYDAVYLLVDMIKKQGITNDPSKLEEERGKIKDGLPKVSGWVGLGGPTTLGEDGEVRREIMIGTVKGGKFQIEHLRS